MYFCVKKLLFEHFFANSKMKMTSLKQLFSNLLNKLLHTINCLKYAMCIWHLEKNAQKAFFFWRKNTSVRKRSSLRSQTFLSFRMFLLIYSKLVGTPCRNSLLVSMMRCPTKSHTDRLSVSPHKSDLVLRKPLSLSQDAF